MSDAADSASMSPSADVDYARFFDLSLDMLCVADTSGYFRRLNPAFLATLGFNREEMLARPFIDFVHPDDVEATLDEVRKLAAGERTIDFENRYRCKGGHWKWLSWRAVAQSDGRIYAVARDETERHRVEQIKREFVAKVSHELRTPLTSISGALRLLDGGAMGSLPPAAAKLIATAGSNAQRLLRLINDLLDVEQVSAGKMHFDLQVQSVMAAVDEAVAATEAFAAQHQARIAVVARDDLARVRVDSFRLVQVMINLLSNAAKFSPVGGVVKVVVKSSRESVRIEVSDHGGGIPEAFRGRVFDRFSQAEGQSARSGSGLGLAIAKELVERMGGRIDFVTATGLGSTFFVEFPRHTGSSLEPMLAGPAHLLLVADDAEVAGLLRLALQSGGFQCEVAGDGEQAMQHLVEHPYDAVVLDLGLPDMQGGDLLRRLRANAGTAELPVVLVSAQVEAGQLVLGSELSALDWIAKPVDPLAVLDAVVALVKRQRSQSALLHVNADGELQRMLQTLADDRLRIERASGLAEAQRQLSQSSFAAVVLDLWLPDGGGGELLSTLGRLQPRPSVLFLDSQPETGDRGPALARRLREQPGDLQSLIATLHRAMDD